MNDILGAALRKLGKRRKAKKIARFLRARRVPTKTSFRRRRKVKFSLWARLSPEKKRVLIKAAKKNPRLRALLLKAAKKKSGKKIKSSVISQERSINNGIPPAAEAPIADTSPYDSSVEENIKESPIVEDESSVEESQHEEASPTVEETLENELTEPSEEEAEEDETDVDEIAEEAIEETSGDLLLGWLQATKKLRRRRNRRIDRAVERSKPYAFEISRLSGGLISAGHILGAVKLIQRAKQGNKRAKRGIRAVVRMSKSKRGDKRAKKAVAKLQIANQILKKTAKKSKVTPYSKPVIVKTKGLDSYSSYQRGMAMIPGFARARFGTA